MLPKQCFAIIGAAINVADAVLCNNCVAINIADAVFTGSCLFRHCRPNTWRTRGGVQNPPQGRSFCPPYITPTSFLSELQLKCSKNALPGQHLATPASWEVYAAASLGTMKIPASWGIHSSLMRYIHQPHEVYTPASWGIYTSLMRYIHQPHEVYIPASWGIYTSLMKCMETAASWGIHIILLWYTGYLNNTTSLIMRYSNCIRYTHQPHRWASGNIRKNLMRYAY